MVFGYFLPVGCQFISLVFGFIRNKNDKIKIKIGADLPEEQTPGGDPRDARMEDDYEINSAHDRSNEDSFFVNNNELSKSAFLPRRSNDSVDSRFNMDYFDPPVYDYLPMLDQKDKSSSPLGNNKHTNKAKKREAAINNASSQNNFFAEGKAKKSKSHTNQNDFD